MKLDSGMELENLSDDELREIEEECLQSLTTINAKLDDAKIRYKQEGVKRLEDWFVRTRDAGNHCKILHRRIANERTRRKQQRRQSFESSFITMAKAILPPEIFQQIHTETELLVNGNGRN
jgi:hypothetical protein